MHIQFGALWLLVLGTVISSQVLEGVVDVSGENELEHMSSRLAPLQARQKEHTDSRDVDVLSSLINIGQSIPAPVGKRIAIGWNSNVDMIVNGCDVVREDFPQPNPRDVTKIRSLSDFADSFAFWFEKGAAAERFVESAELFLEIVELSKQSERVEFKTGGNAALMATVLASENCQCDVLLGGLVGSQLADLLSPKIRTVANSHGNDAIHLILEYGHGEKWGEIVSPRHNRFIVVHDEYNANIGGLEALSVQMEEQIQQDLPFSVFVASGLNQLEGLDEESRENRLSAVVEHLRNISTATLIHLELASMADKAFLLKMFGVLVRHSNSLGLNEEELAMLYEVLGGAYADNKASVSDETFTREMLTGRVPNPRAISLALLHVHNVVDSLYASDGSPDLRQVSRIHFHCLSFHIITIRESPNATAWGWNNRTDAAVARGALTAASTACAMSPHDLNMSFVDMILPSSFDIPNGNRGYISSGNPVAVWNSGGHKFYLTPVPVCKKPTVTVGLGDAISASALAYSLL